MTYMSKSKFHAQRETDFARANRIHREILSQKKVLQPYFNFLNRRFIQQASHHYYCSNQDFHEASLAVMPDSQYAIYTRSNQLDLLDDLELATHMNVFPSMSAFNTSPIIYQIDKDYVDEIKTIPLSTPITTFSKIPHIALYIDFPVFRYKGFLVVKCKLVGVDGLKITFWLDNPDLETAKEVPMISPLGIFIPTQESNGVHKISTVADVLSGFEILKESAAKRREIQGTNPLEKGEEASVDIAQKILSVLLWLCVEEPDISDFSGKCLDTMQLSRNYYKNNGKGVLLSPSAPIVRVIGRRLGGEIRKFKEEIERFDAKPSNRTVRPHIRSGHWHGYWVGNGENKTYTLKWLNSMLVNVSGEHNG